MSALLGVPRLLDAMRAHYGGVASPDAARPPAGGGGLLPAELRALRQGLLNVALSLLHLSAIPSHKAPRIAPDDIQASTRDAMPPVCSPRACMLLHCTRL